MTGGSKCGCGTFAIGACTQCSLPVCGERECSGRFGGQLLCAGHLHEAAQEAKDERERMAAQAHADRLAFEQSPVEMTDKEAFAWLFLKVPDRRHVNSAEAHLSALSPQAFSRLTYGCLVLREMAGKPQEGTDHRGSTQSVIGRALWKSKSYRSWSFTSSGVKTLGYHFTQDGRWRMHSSSDGDPQVYGTYIELTDEMMLQMVNGRADWLRWAIANGRVSMGPAFLGSSY